MEQYLSSRGFRAPKKRFFRSCVQISYAWLEAQRWCFRFSKQRRSSGFRFNSLGQSSSYNDNSCCMLTSRPPLAALHDIFTTVPLSDNSLGPTWVSGPLNPVFDPDKPSSASSALCCIQHNPQHLKALSNTVDIRMPSLVPITRAAASSHDGFV